MATKISTHEAGHVIAARKITAVESGIVKIGGATASGIVVGSVLGGGIGAAIGGVVGFAAGTAGVAVQTSSTTSDK